MNADGSTETRRTTGPKAETSPAWAPGGGQLTFSSGAVPPPSPDPPTLNRDIEIMNGDGTGRARITIDPAADLDPDWNPVATVDPIVACGGRVATVDPTLGELPSGNDVISGRPVADVVNAGGGRDLVCARAGADVVDLGGGDDRAYGGGGPDVLRGSTGVDILSGDDGRDDLRGGPDRDTCRGGAGIDTALTCETRIGIP